ncbi:hypothetical protein [Microbacterium sp. JZ37]|uniref:hypothetical protein n=1 Tax=Microbacterium sp. JZ37 TaxID=2654193 RepID=UPI002B47B557|nr:hypothetical protein [Microbacterium sp. JZ37]WRH16399.1 hypothetical protein GC092_01945 [Microbacterium sp. JZ37]
MTSTETIDQETTIAVDPVERAVAREIELRLGSGRALLDAETGSPLQFVDDTAPERTYLLDGRTPWHSLEHAWGSGHVVADTFAGRWNAPHELEMDGDVVRAAYKVGPLVVDVERRGGDLLQETYRFRNTSDSTIRITGLAVQTPFADLYPGALDALTRRVHAHVFTGGRWAWVAAQPMDGRGHVLGLRVTEGELWSYSVETRNANTISNARGHLVLNVTDRARNPDAFGGQPALALDAGAEYVLGWELGWHSDIASFIEATHAPAEFSALAATVGEPISIRTPCEVRAAGGVEVVTEPGGARITARVHGLYAIRLGDGARSEVLFHDSVADAVRKRAEFVMRYQLGRERPGLLSHAILPVDTRTRLTQLTNGWSDWTDGSERIGVAIMLQHGVARGWLGAEVDDALDGWAGFAREHLLDDTAAPRRGSQQHHAGIRLYDSPWLARFFLLRHAHRRRAEDLELAARILERALELGIGKVLTIGFSEVAVAVASALAVAGASGRAGALRSAVVESARQYAARGADLPGHEVAYEQAIVAPLLNLLIDAHALTGDEALLEAIRERLPWLLAFGGPQPHARLGGIAIRHWDGYWFGQRRQWGDVFPHYWSALTAGVLLRLPSELRTSATDALADRILRANMANYGDDGSATCAFVMPSSVDGVPAHSADPLANDQDFHLALWMQLASDGYTTLP